MGLDGTWMTKLVFLTVDGTAKILFNWEYFCAFIFLLSVETVVRFARNGQAYIFGWSILPPHRPLSSSTLTLLAEAREIRRWRLKNWERVLEARQGRTRRYPSARFHDLAGDDWLGSASSTAPTASDLATPPPTRKPGALN